MSRILGKNEIDAGIAKLAAQISARAGDGPFALIGIRSRGDEVAERVKKVLNSNGVEPEFGVLAPGDRHHVLVTFRPGSCARYQATVEVTGPCLPQPVTCILTGEGTYDELPHRPGM